MRASQRWTMDCIRCVGVALAVFRAASAVGQVTTVNWWTGGAGTTNWSHAANWAQGVPSSNHYVRFGYKGDAEDVPDVPQVLYVDLASQYVGQVQFDCDGARAVTLSGSNLTLRTEHNESAPGRSVHVPASATGQITVDLHFYFQTAGSPNFYHNSTNAQFVVGPQGYLWYDRYYYNYAGDFLDPYGVGVYRLEGRWGNSPRAHALNWVFAPAPGVPWSMSGLSVRSSSAYVLKIRLEEDATISSRIAMSDTFADLEFRRAGAGERSISCGRDLYNSALRTVFLTHADDADEGHLTMRIAGLKGGGPKVHTTTNTTLEFVNYTITSADRHILWANNPGVTGPGRVRLNTTYVFDVYRQLEHTGGTQISNGTWRLMSYGVSTNGALPDTGMVAVFEGATLNVNGIDDTIGGLGGEGTVTLNGATLTVAEGLAPGMSAGTLTVSETGALVLGGGGTHTFEFSADTNVFDRVVFSDAADLTLDGVLELTAPEGFSEYGVGSYTIMSLNGGSIGGAFAQVIPPDRMIAEVDTTSGDVVLILTQQPTGTAILVR